MSEEGDSEIIEVCKRYAEKYNMEQNIEAVKQFRKCYSSCHLRIFVFLTINRLTSVNPEACPTTSPPLPPSESRLQLLFVAGSAAKFSNDSRTEFKVAILFVDSLCKYVTSITEAWRIN
ncbi:hypothetical protein KIN20_011401 [Parelaphostrongylus tenuis]|uniref:Uncharacterized protein n=1 Tax=Parelaphostrongylus tenuis TaxID=148309 RepID=A0AAD5QM11_PARTN|nr:hypothetical protein KIN20_011401 [Parelaphostrongylus tenuis]